MIEFSPVSVTHEGVSVHYRDHFTAKLAKVNARLAKLGGVPAATIAFGPVVTRTAKNEFGWDYSWDEFDVTITGVEAKLAGWSPVASLDHTLDANEALVARFPAHFETVIPDSFRFRGSVCDHCNISIARNTTVLFLHDDGRWAQVGTTCILEYIGVDPRTVLMLSAWNVRCDEDDEPGSRSRIYVEPVHFIAAAAEATRINGFVKSGAEYDTPTKHAASDLAYGRIKPKDLERLFPGLDQARGVAKAIDVMAWIAGSTDASDFMTSARLACRTDRATERTEGILACLPSVFDREMGKRVERAAKNANAGYLGEVGKKLIVTGTVTVASTFEGTYGMKRIIVVTDVDGNAVKTSGSGASLWDAEVGDLIRFEGKVSEHADSKYGLQTVVKMAKVFSLAADGTVLPSASSATSQNHFYGVHDDAPHDACYHCVTASKKVVAA